MNAVQTLEYMATQSDKSIKEVITDYLRPWPKKRQLDELLKIFNDSYDLDEIIKYRSLKEAIPLLKMTIRDRLDDLDAATRSKSIQYLTLNDITKVLNRVKYSGGELANVRESDYTCTDAEASLNLRTRPSVKREKSGGKDEDGRSEDEDNREDGTGEDGDRGDESEGDGDGERDEEDGEARDRSVEEGGVRKRTRKREHKKRKRGTRGEVEADARTTVICRCPVTLAWDIQGMKGKNDNLSRLKLLGKAIKDTDSEENTEFLHLDLNTTQYVKDGSGSNLLSSSIAIDDEQLDGWSSSAVGDALVGCRKWTDPQVLQERDILLGDNNKAAHSYVSRVRVEMVKRSKKAFEQLEVIETKAFSENSYFHRKKFRLSIRSGIDSEESDEDSPV
ncbi:MAG: hypothetical protein M1813_002797 [Trichoglossum hirsutum]|nr:MAG: hypothetical protein M1813_002797 [Trichoglossum hirsutum]